MNDGHATPSISPANFAEIRSTKARSSGIYFVDKILKGAQRSDLPVERPTRFDLVINLKAAKELVLTVPPSLLAPALTR